MSLVHSDLEAGESCSESAILIDAYSQIFRAFFAVAHLSTPDGFPTNALFAFTRMLMQIEKNYAPRSGAMFFDCGKPAFRLELNPEYKGNRPPMPEELKQQLPILRELISAFGYMQLQQENYEADDLIGAMVHTLPEARFQIVSSDKDLTQLVSERVVMLTPNRKGSGFENRGVAETLEKFAVAPTQIIDYLALLGDSSDNIGGVPGIGVKTAALLLQKYGSCQAMLEHPEQIENSKQREKLEQNKSLLERNIALVQLRSDWPEAQLGPAAACLQKASPDWKKIRQLMEQYHLRSLLKELPPEAFAIPQSSSNAVAEATTVSSTETMAEDDLFGNWQQQQPEKPDAAPQTTSDEPLRQDDLFGNF